MKSQIAKGEVVLVFDSRLWNKNGGDSKTDSFFREATVMKVYEEYPGRFFEFLSPADVKHNTMIDVKFHYDGHFSCGHFATAIKGCKN